MKIEHNIQLLFVKQKPTNNQHRTTNTKQPTPNNQQTTNNKQPTTNNLQPTTNNKQQTTNNKQQTTNNQQPGWRGSKAKLQLQRDLITGFVPLDKTVKAREVHSKRAVYQQFPLQQFADRLCNMRKRIGAMKEAAFNNDAALQHDLLLYPTATHEMAGQPRW